MEKRYVSVVAAYCKENKSLDAYWRLDFFLLFIHDTCFANDVMQAFFLSKGDHDKPDIKDDSR